MAAMTYCPDVGRGGVSVYEVEVIPEQGCRYVTALKPVPYSELIRPAAIAVALEDFKIAADDPTQRRKRPLQELAPASSTTGDRAPELNRVAE